MKTKLNACSYRPFRTLLALAVLFFAAGGPARADTATTIRYAGTDFEGRPTLQLNWPAWSNATYLVQSTTDLSAAGAWQTMDLVTPTNGVGQYEIKAGALAESSASFYRLILPSPQIFSVEPAIVAPGVPVDFYVLGQCFPTNVVLQINGVTPAGAAVVSSSLATVPGFVPDVAGTYQVSLVVSGQVVSAFSVVCADALASPELVLQGPPAMEPPASPSALWLSKKGYEYYKNQSDFQAKFSGHAAEKLEISWETMELKAGKAAPPENGKGINQPGLKLFDDSLTAGFSAPPETGKGINKPGIKRGIDPVSASFEVAEGKKGLNAVNVKLARTAGGSVVNGGAWCWGSAFSGGGGDGRGGSNHGWVTFRVGGVIPFSGEVQECAVDLAIPGRELDFVWARTYHSRLGRSSAPNGWTFSYDVSVQPPVSGACVVREGTGRADTFKLGTNGTYTCPEFFREGTLSNNTFTLTFADTGRWVFNPFDGTAAAGKLHQVITRNGSVMTLGYSASNGRLTQVVDDLDRTNTVAYDTSGRLASVTDFSGRTVTYKYYQGQQADLGSVGDLKSVTSPPVTGTPNGNDFPTGKITRYTYTKGYPLALDRQNHLLIACVDALGQTNVQFTYDLSAVSPSYLRCTASQCGANPPTVCSWTGTPHVPVLPTTLKCTVNDPVGNVTECFFDARGRCVAEREFTGRATPGVAVTDTSTLHTSKLRDSDPDYFETQCTWNNDSLCGKVLIVGGQSVQFVYQSDFDPATPARKRADCRVVRELASSPVDLDGDGLADTSERAWHFDYDPRFGSSDCYKWRKAVLDGKVDRRSISVIFHNDASEEAAYHAVKTKGTGANSGIADDITFGREKLKATTKTQGDFNLSNRAMFEDLWPSQGDLDFNDQSVAYNFCTSATDPRGNVTESGYDAAGNMTSNKIKLMTVRTTWNCAYDPHGQLTAITNAPDANGYSRVDTFAWSQGQMTQCVIDAGADGLALTSAFEYDARGNMTRYVDPRTNDWLFAYNSLDQPVESSSATVSLCFCKIKVDYFYDANDKLVRRSTVVLDPAGNAQGTCADNYRYDSLQRLTECALAVDPSHVITNRYVYDANDQCVQVLGPDAVSGADPHQTTAFEYDERGLLFHETTAPGSTLAQTKQFDYTPSCKIKRFNVELYVEQMAFDGFDRPSVGTDPMGNQTVCFYDACDNLRVARSFGELNDVTGSAGNVRLAESRYEYDSLGQCTVAHELHFNPATQTPIGDGEATTQFAYAPNGQCTSVTDDLGLMTSFECDTAGRAYKIKKINYGIQAETSVTVCARDRAGNVTSVTETNTSTFGGPVQVFASTYAYDALGRLVSCTDSAGNTSSCAYDSLGRVVRATDALGNDTTYAYDFMGDCLTRVSYAGSSSLQPATVLRSSSATYDSSLRCASATDANGNTTSCAYDTLGNYTQVTRPDGTHQQLVWSPRSNLLQATDPNGTVSVCTYDLNDRLVRRDITMAGGGTGGGGATFFEAFTYDGCDRLTSETDNDCGGACDYDSLGNCVHETLNGLITSSTYDALGNRLSLTYPGGRVLTYAYDAASRCTGITESGKPLASFAYTGSRLSQETCGNGVRTQVSYDGLVGSPNDLEDHGFGQVSRVRHALVATSSVLSDCRFGWDLKQNKALRTVAIPGNGGRTNEMLFAYDAVDQLVQSAVLDGTTVLRNTTYGFDRMGNRTNVMGAACAGDYTMDGSLLTGLFDFQMNQYTTTPCDTRSYDANGNLLSRSSATGQAMYQYDYDNRLVSVQAVDFSGGTAQVTTSTYAYDALGRRVAKSVTAGTLTTLKQYCYDGSCVIEERENSAVTASYVLEDCALIGMRLGTQDYFVHTDDQGNTLALTGANGAIVERYDCDDYGAVTFLTSDGTPTSATSSVVGNPYCWGGLRLDAETGLQNDDGGGYFESQSGRPLRTMFGLTGTAVTQGAKGTGLKRTTELIEWREIALSAPGGGNNPWTGGPSVDMKTGVVKFFNEAKGFGFIKEENGPEVAKHYITIPHNLSKVKALGANGEGKKEFVGHVSLLK